MTIRSIRRAIRWPVLCGLWVGLLAAGCGKVDDATSRIELTMQEDPTPPRVGPATIRFSLTDNKTEHPVTNAEIQVEGNMTHPGMAPSRAEAIEVAPGDYKAQIDFTMRGDWYLLFNVRLSDGRTLTREVNVNGVRE